MELIKVKKRRVSARELQANISKIMKIKEWILADNEKTIAEIKELDMTTDEGKSKYLELKAHLDEHMELYSTAQQELDAEYVTLKKYRDSKLTIPPDKLLTTICLSGLTLFALALDRESPKAVKLASFVMKIFPFKM